MLEHMVCLHLFFFFPYGVAGICTKIGSNLINFILSITKLTRKQSNIGTTMYIQNRRDCGKFKGCSINSTTLHILNVRLNVCLIIYYMIISVYLIVDMKIIDQNKNQISKLCSTNKVKSLFAFGSVTTDNLKPISDIDLIVDIDEKDPISYSDYYFNLKFQLEKILNRSIDLLETKAIKNPYLKNQIDKTKVLIYGK